MEKNCENCVHGILNGGNCANFPPCTHENGLAEWRPKQLAREPQCRDQADLYEHYARVLRMCKVAEFERPWECVKIKGYSETFMSTPLFNETPKDYEFALAIVEGKPVWRGDVLYCTDVICHRCKEDKTNRFVAGEVEFNPNKCSWNPPKPATISINGVEVPDPVAVHLEWDDIGNYQVTAICQSEEDARAMKAALEGRKP